MAEIISNSVLIFISGRRVAGDVNGVEEKVRVGVVGCCGGCGDGCRVVLFVFNLDEERILYLSRSVHCYGSFFEGLVVVEGRVKGRLLTGHHFHEL